ncbi:MAG: 5-bromo-4-chloroindolyl phosphate hydrolysis family protein [Thermodesulfobacteriota bacterium]|nr:5-bromo-4-chloroindolyl phosphate hydrolysis family protein [Thermodesulfobacteriota bacterium]
MGKRSRQRPHQVWPQVLESVAREGAKLAAHWLPKGAAELEKQVQDYKQRRQQAAALAPRKSRLLWLLPLPLIPATVIALGSGQFTAFISNASAYGLYLAGAMLARHGFQQEVSQRQQQFQTAFRWPFKTLGGLTVALATALTAWAGAGHSIPIALAFGGGAFAAFILLYGLDPRRQPVVAENRSGNVHHLTEMLQQAEQKILSIEQASKRINQPELKQRLTRIIVLARDILAEIARDPKDLRRARKFLNTYLDGAQRVITGYAETHAIYRVHTLEANFRRVLVTIEDVFGQQHQRLLENDLRDLDVNMEVLEAQLKHEGLD